MTMRLLLIGILMTLAACTTSPNNRYYTLSPSPVAEQAIHRNWELSAITIPELLNRPQIILKSGANSITIEEYNRWAEPLDGMITHVLNDNLTARMGLHSEAPEEYRISITIDELDADNDGNVFLSAFWTVQTGEETKNYKFQLSEHAKASDIGSIVAAMSTLLGSLSDTISSECSL